MSKIKAVVDEYPLFSNIIGVKSSNASKIYPTLVDGEVKWIIQTNQNNVTTSSYINTEKYNFIAPLHKVGDNIKLRISDDFVINNNDEIALNLAPMKFKVHTYIESVYVKNRIESKRVLGEVLERFVNSINSNNPITVARNEYVFLDTIVTINDIFTITIRYILNKNKGIYENLSVDDFTLFYKSEEYELESNNIYKIPMSRFSVSNKRNITEEMVADYINNSDDHLFIKDRNQSVHIKIVDYEGIIIKTNDGNRPNISIDNIEPDVIENGYLYEYNEPSIELVLNGTNIESIDFSNSFTLKNIILRGNDDIVCDVSDCNLDLFECRMNNIRINSFINAKLIKTNNNVAFQSYYNSEVEEI